MYLVSFVIPTKDNPDELSDTLNSIVQNVGVLSQLVVVDGGDQKTSETIINKIIQDKHDVIYIRDNAKGVYPAQNLGIKACSGRWIIMLNSGDVLKSESSEVFNSVYLKKLNEYKLLVFSQNLFSEESKGGYVFRPTKKSIWPHQSVLVKKEVYDKYGLYREDLKSGADQYYLAVVRKKERFKIIDIALTNFKLGGLSSGISLSHSKEIYLVRRKLGYNRLYSLIRAYIYPYVREGIKKIFGQKTVNKIKKIIFRGYS